MKLRTKTEEPWFASQRGMRVISSPQRSDRLRGLPIFFLNGHRGMKLATHLYTSIPSYFFMVL
jgi:hypothetical protein